MQNEQPTNLSFTAGNISIISLRELTDCVNGYTVLEFDLKLFKTIFLIIS